MRSPCMRSRHFGIDESGIIYSPTFRNRTILLLSVDAKYSGEYSCKILMKTGGYDAKVSTAHLEVLEVPEFHQSAQTEIETDYGSSVEVFCNVSGTPEPTVKWYRNAQELDFASDQYWMKDDNTLVIKKVSSSDSAMFQCLAANEAGEKSIYAWIKVKSE
jgi:protein sidekick